jgi:hypothetical protein
MRGSQEFKIKIIFEQGGKKMRIRNWAFLVVTVLALASLFLIVPKGSLMAKEHSVTLKPVIPAPGQLAAPSPLAPCINPVYDCGDSEGDGTWSYICEREEYQAWFGFDVSGIPDDAVIQSITFSAYILYEQDPEDPPSAQRTLWYEPDDSWIGSQECPGDKPLTELVSTITHSNTEFQLLTFNLDLSQHDWKNDLADDYISLMLTGPLDYEHLCGVVLLTESGSEPCLTINFGTGAAIPALNVWGAIVLSLILMGSAILVLRRRTRVN